MQIKTLTINGVTYEILGEKGEPGYTPQKGVDYYTEVEKQELVQQVIAALPDGDEVSY